jgi:hypothetical protein
MHSQNAKAKLPQTTNIHCYQIERQEGKTDLFMGWISLEGGEHKKGVNEEI